MPQPFEPSNFSGKGLPDSSTAKEIPETANIHSNCSQTQCSEASNSPQIGFVFGVIGVVVALAVAGLFLFSWCRRQKQKIGSTFDSSDSRLSTDQAKAVYKKSVSPLINLEYSNGWDPLAKGSSGYSQEVLESFYDKFRRSGACNSKLFGSQSVAEG